jgi:hypothetical protein
LASKERLAQLAALGAQVQGGRKAVGAKRASCARDPVGGSKEEEARGRRAGQRTCWRSVYAFGNSLWKSLIDRDKLSR